MRLFDVQYDTTLFVDALDWDDLQFSSLQRDTANVKLADSPLRPDPVQAIWAASARDDEDYDDEDSRRVVVSITLRLQMIDEAAAERWPPPKELLGKVIARLFQDAHVDSSLAFEEPWEVLRVSPVT